MRSSLTSAVKRYHATPEEAEANGWNKAWWGETKNGERRVYAYRLPYRQRAFRAYWLKSEEKDIKELA